MHAPEDTGDQSGEAQEKVVHRIFVLMEPFDALNSQGQSLKACKIIMLTKFKAPIV